MILNKDQQQYINKLADDFLYIKALELVKNNQFEMKKTQLGKLRGLDHTLSGSKNIPVSERINVLIRYLNHQLGKDTKSEEEKEFFNSLKIILSSDELVEKLPDNIFPDCIIPGDLTKEEKRERKQEIRQKKEQRNVYKYFLIQALLQHVIIETAYRSGQ